MADIRVLDKHVAELIAAGEVVERPASIVKELLENAIDAGASVVTVEIKNGGVTYLSVCDNGCGIPRDQVATAFLRHATSKVRTEQDLDAIGTLGFRGEALASVAAVARVELVTRTKEELEGTWYRIEGGVECGLEEVGCAVGTTIVVKDLFYNVPARMKFLKKDVGEANAVAAVVDKIALSHPDVSFRMVRDGQQTLLTPGDNDLRGCIYAVLGRDFSEALIPVDYTLNGIAVHGFIGKPTAARANRTMQHFFVNGRYVKTRTAMAALEQAFKGNLMVGKFPSCVLFIDVPAEAVDVNVHPAKVEVRFVNEKPIFDAVHYGVKNALEGASTIKRPAPMPTKPVVEQPAVQLRFSQPAPAAKPIVSSPPTPVAPTIPSKPVSRIDVFRDDFIPYAPPASSTPRAVEMPVAPAEPVQTQPVEPTTTEPSTPAVTEQPEAPTIRLVGEAFKTYVLAEVGDSIFVIDKHAAHERMLYNELKTQTHDDAQQLLAPVRVTLSKEEYAALAEHLDWLQQAGLELEEFGNSTVLVRSIPMMLSGVDIPALIQEIAGGFLSGKNSITIEKRDWIYHSVACRAAIKAGDRSSAIELEALVKRVLENDDIRYCPHGRPVCMEWTRKELEQKFGRL